MVVEVNPSVLRYRPLWESLGWLLVMAVVYFTLTPSPPKVDVAFGDKISHTLSYFLIMGWFVQLYQSGATRIILAVLFIGLGIGLEYLQAMGGVRHFEVADMIANSLGVLLAALLSRTTFSQWLYRLENRLHRD